MSEPIMCLAAAGSPEGGRLPDEDTIAQFADAGFNYVCYWGASATPEWEKAVALYHKHGFKVIGRWPMHEVNRKEAFQNYKGERNDLGNARLAGPSHWHPAPVERAAKTIKPLKDTGFDGVLVSCLECDRPFPTDWYGEPEQLENTICFWSFDQYAQADWERYCSARKVDMWMPPRADLLQVPTAFYGWYQAGWLRRLNEYTDLAADAGFENVWTWFTPITAWTAEGAANGTAKSVSSLHLVWYEPCQKRGLNPVTVSAVVLNMWPCWLEAAVMSMREACQELGWRAIAGPGCNEGRNVAIERLKVRAPQLAEMGFSGVYAGMSFLEGQEGLTEAGQHARRAFESEQGGTEED